MGKNGVEQIKAVLQENEVIYVRRWFYGKVVIATFEDNENQVFESLVETLNEYKHIDLINEATSDLFFKDGLRILTKQHRVMLGEKEILLSKHEYDVLLLLAQHPGWIFSKEQIYEAVWHENSESCFNAVTNTISRLRKKLEMYSNTAEYIQTLPGRGYRFSQEYVKDKVSR